MSLRVLLLIYLMAALTGGGALYYYWQMAPQTEPTTDLASSVRSLADADRQINEAVLRTRQGLDQNYDRLAYLASAVMSGVSDLERAGEVDGSLERSFRTLRVELVNKIDLLESFKSHNSVLRNSVRYAPTAGEQLAEIAVDHGLPQLAAMYQQATKEVLEFGFLASARSSNRLALQLPQLLAMQDQLPAFAQSMASDFDAHALTVLDEIPLTNSYLESVISAPTVAAFVAAQSALDAYAVNAATSGRTMVDVFLAYAGFLLLGLLLVAYRLRNLYAGLDAQVVARTEEIERAYDELKSSQEHLMRSERMASIGQMVAGVAHEINTPLGYVSSNVDTIRLNVGDLDRMFEGLESISRAMDQPKPDGKVIGGLLRSVVKEYRGIRLDKTFIEIRDLLQDSSYGLSEISELVRNLSDYSRLDRTEAGPYDLRLGLQATLRICNNALRDRVTVKKSFDDVPEIECIPSKVNQVFMNIITNSAQAIEGNGTLQVTLTRRDERHVAVSFVDDGGGMDAETVRQVFDPFFTTKEIGQGTGLGMSIAYKVVKSHGGEIEVESAPGVGTSVTVVLPLRQEPHLLEAV